MRRLLDGVAVPVPRRSVGAPDTRVDFHTGLDDRLVPNSQELRQRRLDQTLPEHAQYAPNDPQNNCLGLLRVARLVVVTRQNTEQRPE